MTSQKFLDVLARRAQAAGIIIPHELSDRLVIYFELLASWNRRMNLAGFDLDAPSDAAVDRLFIEPIVAAGAIGPVSQMLDIGSGGGSPGIPLSLALSPAGTVLAEVKSRKSVFLAEVVRALGLVGSVDVETARFEDLSGRTAFLKRFDLVTVRAVRIEAEELNRMAPLMAQGGRLMRFGSEQGTQVVSTLFQPSELVSLRTASGAVAMLFKLADVPRGTN